MESLDSPQPSSQIEWMYIHKLTEATVASCVVVESSVLYMKVYVDSCCMFSVFIVDDPYHMGECIFWMRIFTIHLLLLDTLDVRLTKQI